MSLLNNRYNIIERSKIVTTHSEIYTATDTWNEYEGIVSVKKIIGIEDSTNISNELFRREFSALQKLDHPNIIKLLDTISLDGERYIITEHFGIGTLDQTILKESIDIQEKLNIIIKLLDAIKFAHDKKIIHRDLKPQNILVDIDKVIKLIDFGVSKILDFKYKTQETLRDFMSYEYASPEQRYRTNITYQSDYYSFGLIIYFILTGQIIPLEERNNMQDIIMKLDCSDNLKEIIIDLSKPKPSDRPKSLASIRLSLQEELIKLRNAGEALYLRMGNRIKQELNEVGAITNSWNDMIAQRYIENDVRKSSIYRRGALYCIVGNNFVYECKQDGSDKILRICNVKLIEDQIMLEQESRRGIEVEIPWNILVQDQLALGNDCIDKYIGLLAIHEKKAEVKKDKEKIKNNLLLKWNKYLDEEFEILNVRSREIRYSSVEIDRSGYKMLVDVKDKEAMDNFEKDEYVIMSDTEEGRIVVGQFDEIVDGKLSIVLKQELDVERIPKEGMIGIDVKRAKMNLVRFANALNAIKKDKTVNEHLPDLLADPNLIEMNKPVEVEKYYQNILNEDPKTNQAMVIKKALGTKDIFLIQGPPGTGKTTVISEIACQILEKNPKEKILLASQSNVAVDHAMNKIDELLVDEDKKIIRIGRSSSNKISSKSQNLLLVNQLTQWRESVRIKSELATEEYVKARESGDVNEQERCERILRYAKEWQRRVGRLEEFDEIFAEDASIVAATCSGIASRHVLNETEFDWVIIDEAARATPLELLVPMIRGRKIILVGDHKQLPPVINTKIENARLQEKGIRTSDLEKSLFEYLFDELKKNVNSEASIILNKQFRMHPAISEMISQVFYTFDGITTDISPEDRNHELKWWPKSIIWMDTKRMKESFERKKDNSILNSHEAKIIFNSLKEMENDYGKKKINKVSVGIISGYNAQKELLTRLIKPKDTNRWKVLDIVIDNVDAFQGSEKDIILYSVVRCNPEGKIGFLKDARRLNVALSRGKKLLIIVGNTDFLEKANSYFGNPINSIIQYIKQDKKNCLIEVENE